MTTYQRLSLFWHQFSNRNLDKSDFSTKLYSQAIAIFRTWDPSEGYISIESLNRHSLSHFLVCNDVLQQLHPLRPKTAKNRVTPTNKTLAQQQDGRRRGTVLPPF
jgi:hypothetical protein